MLAFTTSLIFLYGVAWAVAASWLVVGCVILKRVVRNERFSPPDEAPPHGSRCLVTVLVAARNEERRVLTQCLTSILAQDYGHLEVVAVDDRSTDATNYLLRSVAEEDARLRVIDGAELLPGWLGKPHAMRQAFAASKGDWLLLTDADIIFAEGAVRAAVTHAEQHGFDALTLIPHIDCLSFWERVFMPTCWGVFMMATMPLDHVNDPRRAAALGIGGFFLIRRAWLERIGGFDAVRAEVLEDIRLAELLKGAGARLHIAHAPTLVRTRMMSDFRGLWQGYTKNLFAGMRFSLPAALVGAVSISMFAVMPLVAACACLLMIAAGGGAAWVYLLLPLLVACVAQFSTHAAINRDWGIPVIYAVTAPLSYALFVLILVNSAVRVASGRGVTWKGRAIYERAGVQPPRRDVVEAERADMR